MEDFQEGEPTGKADLPTKATEESKDKDRKEKMRSQKIKDQGEKWETRGGWEKDNSGSWGSGVSSGPRKELNGRETEEVTGLSDYSNVLYLLIMNFISSAWGGYDSAQI